MTNPGVIWNQFTDWSVICSPYCLCYIGGHSKFEYVGVEIFKSKNEFGPDVDGDIPEAGKSHDQSVKAAKIYLIVLMLKFSCKEPIENTTLKGHVKHS